MGKNGWIYCGETKDARICEGMKFSSDDFLTRHLIALYLHLEHAIQCDVNIFAKKSNFDITIVLYQILLITLKRTLPIYVQF